LPKSQREELIADYRDQCNEWLKEVTTRREFDELLTMEHDAQKETIDEYLQRLPSDRRELIGNYQGYKFLAFFLSKLLN
jgi:hypothetical protein